MMEVFRSVAPQRGLQPCTTKGGAEEPRSGIFPKVNECSSLYNDNLNKYYNVNSGSRKSSIIF